jgi:hypothetical protein
VLPAADASSIPVESSVPEIDKVPPVLFIHLLDELLPVKFPVKATVPVLVTVDEAPMFMSPPDLVREEETMLASELIFIAEVVVIDPLPLMVEFPSAAAIVSVPAPEIVPSTLKSPSTFTVEPVPILIEPEITFKFRISSVLFVGDVTACPITTTLSG